MNCRFCDTVLKNEFIDLVNSPPSNSYLTKKQLNESESFFPLKLFVCEKCFLVQIDEYQKSTTIFDKNYAYYSSFSTSWLDHCKSYVDMITDRFGYNTQSRIIELASNDGYLLQYFQKKNIPVLGVEPAMGVAHVAQEKGIETIIDFFGYRVAKQLALENRKADLIIGNNVFAHVPDINDFVAGIKTALKDDGVVTLEFPHLMQLIEENQFDTIYHEHFSYYSFYSASQILSKHGLSMFDVDQISTHGGSLRIYAKHEQDCSKSISSNVADLLKEEEEKGMRTLNYYKGFQTKAELIRNDLVYFLIEQKKLHLHICAYGAAAKGNTLLNYCGIKNNIIDYVVDASPHKQGKYLPGSHIPIVDEETMIKNKPDYILILPWNIKGEIISQLNYMKKWGTKFIIPIPKLSIV